MAMTTFTLHENVTTRQLNAVLRQRIAQALREFHLDFVASDEELRRIKGERRYVFGIHTDHRSTLIAAHTPGSGKVDLVFPNDYKGWDRSYPYDRLRVRIWDLILHHKPSLIDPLGPSHDHSS